MTLLSRIFTFENVKLKRPCRNGKVPTISMFLHEVQVAHHALGRMRKEKTPPALATIAFFR